jgi:hypothetical protein
LWGWPAQALPSGVTKNGAPRKTAGSGTVGVATKCETFTSKRSPRRIGSAGVMTSSSPSRTHVAAQSSTVTEPTLSPAKSRLNRDSAWVARASMVTVPSMAWAGAAVW